MLAENPRCTTQHYIAHFFMLVWCCFHQCIFLFSTAATTMYILSRRWSISSWIKGAPSTTSTMPWKKWTKRTRMVLLRCLVRSSCPWLTFMCLWQWCEKVPDHTKITNKWVNGQPVEEAAMRVKYERWYMMAHGTWHMASYASCK